MKKTDKTDIAIILIILIIGSSIGYGVRKEMEPRDKTPVIDLRRVDSMLTPTPSYYPYK